MGLAPTIAAAGCAANDFTLPLDNVIQLDIEQKAYRRAKGSLRLHTMSHIIAAVFKKKKGKTVMLLEENIWKYLHDLE